MSTQDENLYTKLLVLLCVRNTFLETLHAGTTPVTKTGDYSDVKIIDGEGNEIPWNALSRINEREMEKLIIEVVNKTHTFLELDDEQTFEDMITQWASAADLWEDPVMDQSFLHTSKTQKNR